MAKSKDELIDSKVSPSQCKLAIDALLKHALKHKSEREQNELLPGKEQFVWLLLAVKKVHTEKKLKPFKVPLTHPLVDPRTTQVCLITKDPQREYKDLLESHNIKFISRVVGVQKLKGKFKPFEARRMLLKENGLFLADERVVPLLPKLLGKPFFNAKKQPIPVCLTRKELKTELEGAVSSTYFHQNQGTCSSIKIGTLGFHNATQLLDNLETSLPTIVKNVKGGWTNIQSIHIKTNSSVSLPVWSCKLDGSEGGRWDGLTKAYVEDAESDKGEAEEKSGEEPAVEVEKGKKRSALTIPATEEPRKKKTTLLKERHQEVSVPPKKSPSRKKHLAPTPLATRPGTPGNFPPTTAKVTSVATAKREKKPRPTVVDFFPEPSMSDPTSVTSTPTNKTVTQLSSKKKKLIESANPSSKTPLSKPASKHTPSSPDLAREKSKVKAKAVVISIDKKKRKLVGVDGGKSRSGRVGKSVKNGLLGKKAAGR